MVKRAYIEGDDWVKDIATDNGGRRKIFDRRQFAYTFHIPERRSGDDRRLKDDRRLSERDSEEAPTIF